MIGSMVCVPVVSAENQDRNDGLESLKRKRSITIRKENQIAAADAIRKIQIKSINQHFQFEVQKAEAHFGADLDYYDDNTITDISKEQRKGESVRTISYAAASLMRFTATNDASSLKLQDDLIREDLSDVVRHCELVASKFAKSAPQVVSVAVHTDTKQLRIGTTAYSIGGLVRCFSTLSQEYFHGLISDITSTVMFVIGGNSARFSFPISHIAAGRVVVSSDEENIQNLAILSKYSQMVASQRE